MKQRAAAAKRSPVRGVWNLAAEGVRLGDCELVPGLQWRAFEGAVRQIDLMGHGGGILGGCHLGALEMGRKAGIGRLAGNATSDVGREAGVLCLCCVYEVVRVRIRS